MHDTMQIVIPKKTPLDKYKEQKAAIAAMLAAGDISKEVASQFSAKLNYFQLKSIQTKYTNYKKKFADPTSNRVLADLSVHYE